MPNALWLEGRFSLSFEKNDGACDSEEASFAMKPFASVANY